MLLVTSRTVPRRRGEHALRVLPLPVPPPAGGGRSAAQQRAHASVNLFVERTYAAGFELTNDNAKAVAEICRRLDGLALAIGLPAARVWLLPPRQLLSRSADAHALFARPGVFPGPFTLSAVEAVAGTAGPASWEARAERASDGHAGVAGPEGSRYARPRFSSLLAKQRQLCSNSIRARARLAGALVWQYSAREHPGGGP